MEFAGVGETGEVLGVGDGLEFVGVGEAGEVLGVGDGLEFVGVGEAGEVLGVGDSLLCHSDSGRVTAYLKSIGTKSTSNG